MSTSSWVSFRAWPASSPTSPRDPRVPWTAKVAILGLGAYIVWPNDLIADTIPYAGILDDLLLVTIVMNYVFAVIPEEILLEHWGEDIEPLRHLTRRPRPGGASPRPGGAPA